MPELPELRKKTARILFVLLAIIIVSAVGLFVSMPPESRNEPEPSPSDPNATYRVTVRNNISAPIYDDTYYCAYYKIDGRVVTMYDADSAVTREVVLNVNANCDVRKVQ